MLLGGYLKLAITSIRSARWRSLLTMLGIIIGVVSVITTVSLGEGVKKQVSEQIAQRGSDLVTIMPGEHVSRDESGRIVGFNPLINQAGTAFTESDYKTVQQVKNLKSVVPFGRVVGLVETTERSYEGAGVIATTEGLPGILNQKIEFGAYYKDDEVAMNSAVIGKRVAERLFQENVPLGKSFTIRGREFIVRGVFQEFASRPSFIPGDDHDNAVFIPYKAGQELMGGNIQIYQVLVRPADIGQIDLVIDDIKEALKKNRAGQEDFTILRQEESIALANSVLSLITNLIAGIAAISLLVGGIGIMNIMLVSVTERTREIGVRKAVGATNRQILYQFITEAAVLSLTGGFLGVLLSLLANFLLRILTDLQPVITMPVVGAAGGVALGVGILFGAMPALRAARKDPIVALRHE